MANQARTGTIMYSGVTTTTDSDVLTLTGFSQNKYGGGVSRLTVRNRHASLVLYVRTDGTSPTAAAGDGVTVIPPATAVDVPVRTTGNGTVEVRLISTAACDYNVTALKS
jgi:hypothetical protein